MWPSSWHPLGWILIGRIIIILFFFTFWSNQLWFPFGGICRGEKACISIFESALLHPENSGEAMGNSEHQGERMKWIRNCTGEAMKNVMWQLMKNVTVWVWDGLGQGMKWIKNHTWQVMKNPTGLVWSGPVQGMKWPKAGIEMDKKSHLLSNEKCNEEGIK